MLLASGHQGTTVAESALRTHLFTSIEITEISVVTVSAFSNPATYQTLRGQSASGSEFAPIGCLVTGVPFGHLHSRAGITDIL